MNSNKTTHDWKAIVNSNYYIGEKPSPAVKSDGEAYYGKAQLYLPSGMWVDRYHAKVEGLEIDENSARQIPKARAGYTTVYRVKTEKAEQKDGLEMLLKLLQAYTGKKGHGKTPASKAQNLITGIKNELTPDEQRALGHYLNSFFSVINIVNEPVSLEAVQKACKVGYGIVKARTTEKKKGGK